MAHPVAVTDTDFEEKVLKSKTPVLVDFWAEWCAPCRMIAPIVEELSTEYDGKIAFTKVDVDVSPETSIKYGIRSIPTLLVFKNGKPVDQVIGAVPKSVLKKRLESAIA
ncbi:MAG: thioredoxin [Chloroflexi bacterium]|nr:thioredoxin [Chloroflexota bacterium]